MSRPFDDRLHACRLGAVPQFTEGDQFFELAPIGRVGNASRSKAISQTQGEIIFPCYFDKPVVLFVKGVLSFVKDHPFKEKSPSPAHNIEYTPVFPEPLDGF